MTMNEIPDDALIPTGMDVTVGQMNGGGESDGKVIFHLVVYGNQYSDLRSGVEEPELYKFDTFWSAEVMIPALTDLVERAKQQFLELHQEGKI